MSGEHQPRRISPPSAPAAASASPPRDRSAAAGPSLSNPPPHTVRHPAAAQRAASYDPYNEQIESVTREVRKLKRMLMRQNSQPLSSDSSSSRGGGAGPSNKRQNTRATPESEQARLDEMARELNDLHSLMHPNYPLFSREVVGEREDSAPPAAPPAAPLGPQRSTQTQGVEQAVPQIAEVLRGCSDHRQRQAIFQRMSQSGIEIEQFGLDSARVETVRQSRQVIQEDGEAILVDEGTPTIEGTGGVGGVTSSLGAAPGLVSGLVPLRSRPSGSRESKAEGSPRGSGAANSVRGSQRGGSGAAGSPSRTSQQGRGFNAASLPRRSQQSGSLTPRPPARTQQGGGDGAVNSARPRQQGIEAYAGNSPRPSQQGVSNSSSSRSQAGGSTTSSSGLNLQSGSLSSRSLGVRSAPANVGPERDQNSGGRAPANSAPANPSHSSE